MIRLPLSIVLSGFAVGFLAWIVWLIWLWSPERQAALHTLNLLGRASNQDWTAVGEMMAPDYRDAWEHGKEQALSDAKEFGRHFFSLRVGPSDAPKIETKTGEASVRTRLGVYGSGTPVAHAVIEAVHELEQPFVFRWRKSGPWPWQWVLVRLEQEELAARYPR